MERVVRIRNDYSGIWHTVWTQFLSSIKVKADCFPNGWLYLLITYGQAVNTLHVYYNACTLFNV